MSEKVILLVEDHTDVQNFNRFLLEKQGFVVETAMTLAAARDSMAAQMPDAVILDIGMPDGNGLDFLRELRCVSDVPVLVLTGYNKDDDVVRGFASGCDDYLSKPYTFEVLLARLKHLLKNGERVPERIVYGPLTVDVVASRIYYERVDLQLTPKEYTVLSLFVQNKEKPISINKLYEQVWKTPYEGDSSAVWKQISRLNQKLEKASGGRVSVTSSRSEGYSLEV